MMARPNKEAVVKKLLLVLVAMFSLGSFVPPASAQDAAPEVTPFVLDLGGLDESIRQLEALGVRLELDRVAWERYWIESAREWEIIMARLNAAHAALAEAIAELDVLIAEMDAEDVEMAVATASKAKRSVGKKRRKMKRNLR
jgi:hypothetical protein